MASKIIRFQKHFDSPSFGFLLSSPSGGLTENGVASTSLYQESPLSPQASLLSRASSMSLCSTAELSFSRLPLSSCAPSLQPIPRRQKPERKVAPSEGVPFPRASTPFHAASRTEIRIKSPRKRIQGFPFIKYFPLLRPRALRCRKRLLPPSISLASPVPPLLHNFFFYAQWIRVPSF